MMKKLFPAVFCAALLWGAAAYCNEPAAEGLFTKVKITLSSSNAPKVSGGSNTGPSLSTVSLRNKWLIISVDYTPAMPGKLRHYWIDDVSMAVTAAFIGQSDSDAIPILFLGRTDFQTIAMDARKHTATMMIPPQLLDRYLPSSGSASTVSTTSTFAIQVEFLDRAGTVIGVGYYGSKSLNDKENKEQFDKLIRSKPLMIQNAVLPRSQTPWQWIDADNHDLIKPQAGGTVGMK